MKEKIQVPGAARVMYWIYSGALIVTLYTGFQRFHPFLTGGRYPWAYALANQLNFLAVWVLVLTAFVYLYYSTLGRPKGWREPLWIFRWFIVALTIWFFLLSYAVYQPNGWLNGLVNALGGVNGTQRIYELFLWVIILTNVIYIYARWAVSDRFPRLTASKPEKEQAG